MDDFKRFKSIFVFLQGKGIQPPSVRFTLDEVCKDYPTMRHYLGADASVFNRKPFEGGILKIMPLQKQDISENETHLVESFKVDSASVIDAQNDSDHLSYFERIQARQRRLSESTAAFINIVFIPAIFCSVQPLFSMARWVLTVMRKEMSPILFEAIHFFRIIPRLYGINSVAVAIKP